MNHTLFHVRDRLQLLAGALFFLLLMLPATLWAQDSTQRYALVVGANNGGGDRVVLRYAVKDAKSFASVLEELGGVERRQLDVLVEPSPDSLAKALDQLDAKITSRKKSRAELIFYYSGHSDEEGLLLQGNHYTYKTLRERLAKMPVDVRVVILDSCASGNLTRKKGGRRTPAFLSDSSTQVKGHAFLTSSSEDEAAQESDRMEGSFFTHYLISGMRGAADTTGDRRVTLNEAYQFAFHQTLQRTERTLGGAQHPAYDIQLSGHGDLVLTAYSEGVAVLELDRSLSGKVFIRGEKGELIAELQKHPGRPLELGLPSATYQVQLVRDGKVERAEIKLQRGKSNRLDASMFEEVSVERTVMRGGDIDAQTPIARTGEPSPKIPIGFDFLPWIGVSSVHPHALRRFSFNLLGGVSGGLHGFELGTLVNIVNGDTRGIQIAGVTNVVANNTRGGQVSGVANLTGGNVRGSQLAAFNITRGHMTGLQLGGSNLAADGLVGAQVSAANIAWGSARGMQLGGVNLTRQQMKGLQLSAANLQLGGSHGQGMQLGALNYAYSLTGLQLGAVNLRTGAGGGLFQLGAVNISSQPVKGFSFGAVNISPRASGSFGVINVHWKGNVNLSGWANSEGSLQAGVRMGSNEKQRAGTYNIYSLGVLPLRPGESQDRGPRYSIGWIWGVQRPFANKLGAQADVGLQWLLSDVNDFARSNFLYKARIGARYSLNERVAFYGGPSFNTLVVTDPQDHKLRHLGSWDVGGNTGELDISFWPGLYVGADFF